MKLILQVIAWILLPLIATFISCKKEKSCKDCKEHNKPPIAVAGSDRVITLPADSALLDGSASSDPDGTISEWLWKKITGPASFNIANTSAPKTVVKNLGVGTYQFELKVTDNGGLSAGDTVQITVQIGVTDSSQANLPPVATAGANQNITAFANSCITGNTPSVKLNGSSSYDPDGIITSYQWTKISGPSYYTIASPNAAQTDVNDLIEGTYQFELKIIDNGGLSGRDTVQIAVTAQPSLNCDNSA